ncbi:MAG TPA: hypothetical protein VGE21_00690 [Flavobacteriales bacterium]
MSNDSILQKYFHRTAPWDWLNKDMIHVMDPHAPRMITMDPWPQLVFLGANGERTVAQFIQYMRHQYSGIAPSDLDSVIIEQLGLLVQEGIVAFSDTPIALESALRDPRTAEGRIDLLGSWIGQYTYDHLLPGETENSPALVGFRIDIHRVEGDRFFGTVKDDEATGGTPGTGTISGTFSENGVRFTKQMPIASEYDEKGRWTYENKPHRKLLYDGAFSRDKQHLSGTWRFKTAWAWYGPIPYRVSYGTGEWEMRRTTTSSSM